MVKNVMILTLSTGGGHNKAANAIKEELEKESINAVIVDTFKDLGFTGKIIDNFVSKGYENIALHTPKATGGMYLMSDRELFKKALEFTPVASYVPYKLEEIILKNNTDLVITVHPFASIAVSALKNEGKIDIPIYSVVTDYHLHNSYVSDAIDKYITGDEDMTIMFESYGIENEKVFPFGIPITQKEVDKERVSDWKKEKGLEDKFTILLVGGSFGAGDILKTYKSIQNLNEDIQIIIICGRNKNLKKRIARYIANEMPKIRAKVFGFVDDMEYFMNISDAIITKSGGLTTTECIYHLLPMIVPFYIPGQEEANLSFLINNGMCIVPSRYYPIDLVVRMLYHDRKKLDRMKDAMKIKRKTDSAKNIAKLILSE